MWGVYMNEFIDCLRYTITTYNEKTKKELLKIYKERKIVKKKEKQLNLFNNDAIEIDENNINETLIKCFQSNIESIRLFEKFNFEKWYKYSVLWETNNIKEKLSMFDSIPDINNTFNIQELKSNLNCPIKYEKDNKLMLLFNKKYEAFHPENGETLKLKYSIVVVFHIDINIVEFRFDSIKRIFTGIDRDQSIYYKLIKELSNFIEENYTINLKPISLEKIIPLASGNKSDEIRLCTQHMNFRNGGKAQLKTGDDGKYVMPFVGELKNLIHELSGELSKCPNVRNRLQQFINDKEITSEYPLAEIDFLDKTGNERKNNRVKFTFNYMNSGLCLISYYYNDLLLGMERMNNVTNFIKENIV